MLGGRDSDPYMVYGTYCKTFCIGVYHRPRPLNCQKMTVQHPIWVTNYKLYPAGVHGHSGMVLLVSPDQVPQIQGKHKTVSLQQTPQSRNMDITVPVKIPVRGSLGPYKGHLRLCWKVVLLELEFGVGGRPCSNFLAATVLRPHLLCNPTLSSPLRSMNVTPVQRPFVFTYLDHSHDQYQIDTSMQQFLYESTVLTKDVGTILPYR